MVASVYIEVLKADMKLNKEKSPTHPKEYREIWIESKKFVVFIRVDGLLEIWLLNTISDRKVRKVQHYLPLLLSFF